MRPSRASYRFETAEISTRRNSQSTALSSDTVSRVRTKWDALMSLSTTSFVEPFRISDPNNAREPKKSNKVSKELWDIGERCPCWRSVTVISPLALHLPGLDRTRRFRSLQRATSRKRHSWMSILVSKKHSRSSNRKGPLFVSRWMRHGSKRPCQRQQLTTNSIASYGIFLALLLKRVRMGKMKKWNATRGW